MILADRLNRPFIEMYHDLCLPSDEADAVVHRLRLGTLMALGYGSCAASQSVTGQVSLSDR